MISFGVILYKFIKIITPGQIKTLLRKLGFGRLSNLIINKYDAELIYQQEWTKEFKKNKSKVREFWKRYYYLDEVINICKIDNNKKILDVGCGINTVLHYLKGRRFGIDPLACEYLKSYQYPKGINIKKGFGEKIPFPDKFFDVVFCTNALDHTTNPQKTVKEISRTLKSQGYFVLILEVFNRKKGRDPAHPHCLTEQDIFFLTKPQFAIIFKKALSWISPRAYLDGVIKNHQKKKGLVMVLKKV